VTTRFAAFLRGVNLGKRTVRSADLAAAFAAMGFAGVKTLLASGNVMFDAEGDAGPLRTRIEAGLEEKFGFDVGTVLRSRDELRAMVDSDPFGGATESHDQKLYVTLFATPEAEKLPMPCGAPGDFDVVRVTKTEIFHMAYRKPDGRYSADSAGIIWKPFGKKILWTNRNWNTIVKAAAA
jgi:uncharacterized protein (DUF1697 family)